MTTYTYLENPDFILRDDDQAIIPNEPANIDWVHYQEWLAEGNIPNSYIPIPQTRQQETDAYLALGLTVNAPNSTMGSGTFSVVSPYVDRINSNATYYNVNGDFPGNLPYAEIFDMNGLMHSIPKKDWTKFTSAVGDFVHSCHLYQDNFVDVLPPNVVTI